MPTPINELALVKAQLVTGFGVPIKQDPKFVAFDVKGPLSGGFTLRVVLGK